MFCNVGGRLESAARVTANNMMGGNAPWMLLLWLLRPAVYWLWPVQGIVFAGLTSYASTLVSARQK